MRRFLRSGSCSTSDEKITHEETMKKEDKKQSNWIQTSIAVLTVILVIMIIWMMHLVSGIQGTARVVNYAGLVRGKTQRIIKLEIADRPQDLMLADVESFIDGLQAGSEELQLVKLKDTKFQSKMEELRADFYDLRREIILVREMGYEHTQIIEKSEQFFEICDEATGLAEQYSQKRASSLETTEAFVTIDIVCLMLLIGYEFVRALRYAAQNRALQSKVYLDEATGLPNKNKCEELLNDESVLASSVTLCIFDLNDLRRINNTMGHEMGDEYIRRFAVLLREAMPAEHFVGRDGGDEFLALLYDLDHVKVRECLQAVRDHVDEYSRSHPEFPISYAVGYALSDDYDACTMHTLFSYADKNMYINKNHVKREKAARQKRLDNQMLKLIDGYGNSFTDCLYCDARQDTYRSIRASEAFFLASDGNYSGAVEQIVEEQVADSDRDRLWEHLQLDDLCGRLTEDHPVLELQYEPQNKDQNSYGKLTLIYVDRDQNDKLHHFVLAFETVRREDKPVIDVKQQLTQYYDQFRHSILENDSYVDALLETADAIYSVNLTTDHLEMNQTRDEASEKKKLFKSELAGTCSYNQYCRKYIEYVTHETKESYRLMDTVEKLLQRFACGDKQFAVEYCVTDPDGNPCWIQKTILMTESRACDPVSGKEIDVVHGMILLKDTTVFHEREQKEHDRLQAAYDEVTIASRAKTEFLNRMSHDIRTPINGVMGMLEIIRKNRDDENRVDDCLNKIQISSEHLLSLINDVLDMSKLESGHMELEHVSFPMNELLEKVYALAEAQVAATDITYCAHSGQIRHPYVFGSPLHVRQILLNLFNNAVKYNKPGGSIDTYLEECQIDPDTVEYEFRITDTGIGMSEEFVKEKLFEPFTQEKSDARTQYQGTGLGMSIVKELVEQMKGSIEVSSVEGEGSTFSVTLPFEIDHAPQTQQAIQKEGDDDVSIAGMHVLLVEDNDLNMEIAEFFLQDMGAVVQKAWNGQEAVDLFAASKPGEISVILMDLMMPVMDGLEATKRIRSMDRPDAKSVVILAMTAKAFAEDVKRSKEAGMNEHLSKPLNEDAVRTAINRNCKKNRHEHRN